MSMAVRCGALANAARLMFGLRILLVLFPACIYSSSWYGIGWVVFPPCAQRATNTLITACGVFPHSHCDRAYLID